MRSSPSAIEIEDLEMVSPSHSQARSRENMVEDDDLGGLTEEVMPPPARPDDPREDHLEEAEQASRKRSRSTQSKTNDESLTELQIPSITGGGDSSETSPHREAISPSALEEQKDEAKHGVRRLPTELYVVGHLVFFSILGTLSRLGVEAINTYSHAPVDSPVLWANVGGSLFFGFLAEDRRLFKEEWGTHLDSWSFKPLQDSPTQGSMSSEMAKKHLKVKKSIPLYIGLSTGFCGSFTSFSTFIRDAFLALGGQLGSVFGPGTKTSANAGYRFEAVLAIIIVHVACSLGALKFGAHLALATQKALPTLPFRLIRCWLDPTIVVLGLGCWLGAVVLAIWPPHDAWRGQVVFSLVFAPVGCLFRFYLSKHLNPRKPSFPLGTFSVNISGTAALGICFIIQRSGRPGVLSCQVLQGLMDGFSGCATTVSTWVGELDTLRRKHAYVYGVTSIVVALAFLVVIMGGLLWSVGFDPPACTI